MCAVSGGKLQTDAALAVSHSDLKPIHYNMRSGMLKGRLKIRGGIFQTAF